ARYARFFHAMLERGVYLPPAQFETAFVSTAHTEDDVDAAIGAFRATLEARASVIVPRRVRGPGDGAVREDHRPRTRPGPARCPRGTAGPWGPGSSARAPADRRGQPSAETR